MTSSASSPGSIEPYLDQVSGHSCLFRNKTDAVIYKPLYPKEQQFYQDMPHDMKEFTPAYRGTIAVRAYMNGDGTVSFGICPNIDPNDLEIVSSEPDPNQNSSHLKVFNKNPQEQILSNLDDEAMLKLEMVRCHDGSCSLTKADIFWNHRLLNKWLESSGGHPKHFLILENLTDHMKRPCVMDIKMGTRQHADCATDQKKLNQIRKCLSTTSSSLGIRVCGMKMYDSKGDRIIWCNKYFGRTLTKEGVEDLLRIFLRGHILKHNSVPSLVDNLKRMRDVISAKDGFRFYSSSLLIAYDADDIDRGRRGVSLCEAIAAEPTIPIQAHLVDFELSSGSTGGITGPDNGLIFGLGNIIAILQRISLP